MLRLVEGYCVWSARSERRKKNGKGELWGIDVRFVLRVALKGGMKNATYFCKQQKCFLNGQSVVRAKLDEPPDPKRT